MKTANTRTSSLASQCISFFFVGRSGRGRMAACWFSPARGASSAQFLVMRTCTIHPLAPASTTAGRAASFSRHPPTRSPPGQAASNAAFAPPRGDGDFAALCPHYDAIRCVHRRTLVWKTIPSISARTNQEQEGYPRNHVLDDLAEGGFPCMYRSTICPRCFWRRSQSVARHAVREDSIRIALISDLGLLAAVGSDFLQGMQLIVDGIGKSVACWARNLRSCRSTAPTTSRRRPSSFRKAIDDGIVYISSKAPPPIMPSLLIGQQVNKQQPAQSRPSGDLNHWQSPPPSPTSSARSAFSSSIPTSTRSWPACRRRWAATKK